MRVLETSQHVPIHQGVQRRGAATLVWAADDSDGRMVREQDDESTKRLRTLCAGTEKEDARLDLSVFRLSGERSRASQIPEMP